MPLPALTTISASVKGTSPLTLLTAFTLTLGDGTFALNELTSAIPSPTSILYALGLSAMIFISVFSEMFAKAFPEKTFFLTTNPLLVSGKATAPATRPALRRADNRGAIALPSGLLENTTTFAPVPSVIWAITFV